MSREMTIAGVMISDDSPCYVVAEIGGNHGGSVAAAQALIRMSALAGASAVKFQKRDVATLYTRALRDSPYEHEHSYGRTYGEHRAHLELSIEAYRACQLMASSSQCGHITLFATAFDESSAAMLIDECNMPALKLASGSLTDLPLIRAAAAYGRPLIVSTGGGDRDDVARAVRAIGDRAPFALLHCTASYPLAAREANLSCITTLRADYPGIVVGWSSHSPGISLSLGAYMLGAQIIEHHVTLNRAGTGTDHAFSLERKGLETLVEDLAQLRVARGDGIKRVYPSEAGPIAKMRRTQTSEGWKISGLAPQEDVWAQPSK